MLTTEDIKNEIKKKQELQKIRENEPDILKNARKMSGSLFNDPSKGKITPISYDYGSGNLFERGLGGDYHMKYENYLGATGNEDRLAKQQSFTSKWTNGVTKNVAKLGLYLYDNTAGIINGVKEMFVKGKLSAFYDNDFADVMDYASKDLDRNLPNYYSDEEKSKNFFGKLLTANFWANDFLNGVAFIGGAAIPGILTGGTSLAPTIVKGASKLGFNALRKEGTTLLRASLRNSMKGATVGKVAGGVVDYGKFVLQSTLFESGMEARHNLHDSLDRWVNSYYSTNGKMPNQDEIDRYVDGAETASNGVFFSNIGLLAVTNAAMFGKSFGLSKLEMPKDNMFNRMIGIGSETLADGTAKSLTPNKFQKLLGHSYYIGRKSVSEGIVEEGLQGVINKMADTYTEAKYNGDNTYSLSGNFFDAFKEQYGTREGWNEIGTGMIVGMLGGNVTAIGNRDNLGIEGIFGGKGVETYNRSRNGFNDLVDSRNQAIETFRSVNRANSMFNNQVNKDGTLQDTELYQDTVANYNYIKASEGLKGSKEMRSDFDAIVDNMNITEEQLEMSGLKDVDAYKSSIKSQFESDYTMYKKSRNFVNNLGISDVKLSSGDMLELKDSLTMAFMFSQKAEEQAKSTADNIESMTGISGAQSALKFTQTLNAKQQKLVTKLIEQENNLQELQNEIVKIQNNISENKAIGDQTTTVTNLSKKYAVVSNKITELTESNNAIKNILNNELKAINKADLTDNNTYDNIDSVISTVKNINTMIDSFNKVGRKEDAKALSSAVEQFKLFTQTAIDGKLTFDAMMNSNFFSGKKGKTMISSIVGKKYEPTPEAIEEIKNLEDIIIQKANNFGMSIVDSKGLLDTIKSDNKFSEREKHKLESMLRAMASSKAIEDRALQAEESFNSVGENVNVVNTDIDAETINVTSPNIEGDTISTAERLRNINVSNTQQLRDLVDEIANLSDQVVNKPTSTKLKEIENKKKELENLINELNAIQEQETASVIQPQQQEEVVETVGEVTEEAVGQLFIDFPQEDVQIVADEIMTSLEEDYASAMESMLEDFIREEEALVEGGNEEILKEYKELLIALRNGELNFNEVRDALNGTTNETSSISAESRSGEIYSENANNEQVSTIGSGNSGETSENEESRTRQAEQRSREIEERIREVTEEIKDLETPFKFFETSDYKRMHKLLSLDRPLTEVEEIELNNLQADVDNWIKIMGVEIDGILFSDIIEQLVSLEKLDVVPVSTTTPITQEEIDENFKIINTASSQNMSVALNFNAVTSSRKRRNDGTMYTEVANISLDTLEDISGVNLSDRSDVVMNESTNTIQLSDEALYDINSRGLVNITTPEEGHYTYYSAVRDEQNGEYKITKSDFREEYPEGVVDDQDIYNLEVGDSVLVSLDPSDPYNRDEILTPLKKELGIYTAEDIEVIVENEIKTYKPDKLIKIQQKIRDLSSNKSKNKNKIKELEDQATELISLQKDRIRKRLAGKRKDKISKELKKKIKEKLKLYVTNTDSENVSVLKGSRETSEEDRINATKLQAIRDHFAENIDTLIQMIEAPYLITEDLGVKVDKVYPGFPNFYMVRNTDGTLVREYRGITKEYASKVSDIGYIENGKILTRGGLGNNIDTTFVSKQLNDRSNKKIPVIIVKLGVKNIAYPINVKEDAPSVTREMMESVYQKDIPVTQKAIELNQLLAQAGIDVNTMGNAFISTTGNNIDVDFFYNKVAQVENINYLRKVDDFLDKNVSIEDVLLDSGASINIDLTEPFPSPKLKLDFSSVKTEQPSSEEVREESKGVVMNMLSRVSTKKINEC